MSKKPGPAEAIKIPLLGAGFSWGGVTEATFEVYHIKCGQTIGVFPLNGEPGGIDSELGAHVCPPAPAENFPDSISTSYI